VMAGGAQPSSKPQPPQKKRADPRGESGDGSAGPNNTNPPQQFGGVRDRNPIGTQDRNPVGGRPVDYTSKAPPEACATPSACAGMLKQYRGRNIAWGSQRFVTGAPQAGASMTFGGDANTVTGQNVPLVVAGGSGADLSLNAGQLISLLADPLYSEEGKQATEVELITGGLSSVPALVASLKDERVYSVRQYKGPDGTTKQEKITVGMQCENLLYQIITPRYRSSHETAGAELKSGVVFAVADWKGWWEKNKGRSLDAIHGDVRGAVDRYWKEGGVEQKL
jgi:hypothetical protein